VATCNGAIRMVECTYTSWEGQEMQANFRQETSCQLAIIKLE